jgi:flagellar M-ring protein FliF
MASKFIEQSTQLVGSISKGRLFSLIAILLVAAIGFGSLIFWNTRPEYQVLFSNLSPEDAGDIANKLKEKKIPYQVSHSGTAVLVPREQVYDKPLGLGFGGAAQRRGVWDLKCLIEPIWEPPTLSKN